MTTAPTSSLTPLPASAIWARGTAVAVLTFIGTCEALATNPAIGWDWAPGWLSGTVGIVGFLAFLVLFGFTSLLGNLAVAVLIVALVWRRWGWPPWQAVLVAAPYLVAFYQASPKPW